MPHPEDAWLADHIRNVGDRIREERMRQSRTQEWVYLNAGISRWALQEAESGRGNPTLRTLARIAHVLGLSPGDLVR